MAQEKLLVISAHAADFVWRSGGTIASYLERGAAVKVIVLSYGIRGESNHLWKQEGQTTENVRSIRHAESSEAARILGVTDIEFWDFEDYPMTLDRERLDRLVVAIRTFRPDNIITHGPKDAFNPDHEHVSETVFQACVTANSAGALYDGLPATKQMGIFGFEPHQTEISSFVPGTIIDITSVFERGHGLFQGTEAPDRVLHDEGCHAGQPCP